MTKSEKAEKQAIIALIGVWLVSRLLPAFWLFSNLKWKCEVEAGQVRNLLEYGFWARKGALLNAAFDNGLLANPAAHNYVHHPYLIFWIYSFIYWIGGKLALYLFVVGIGFCHCLLVYLVLRRLFSQATAWFTAVIFMLAYSSIEFDFSSDSPALAAIVWPLAVYILAAAHQENRELSRRECGLLGLVVFTCGLFDWFALTAIPALLLFALPRTAQLRQTLSKPFRFSAWQAIVIGGTAALLLFLFQLYWYGRTSKAEDALYLKNQLGANNFWGLRLNPLIAIRMIAAGSALWLGAFFALCRWRKLNPGNWIFSGSITYMVWYLVICMILPSFIAFNQDAHRYLLFPCALLMGLWLDSLERPVLLKMAKAAVLIAAIPFLLFGYAKLQEVHVASQSVRTLARWLAQQTRPSELILANRHDLTAPEEPVDLEFWLTIRHASDRLIGFGVTNVLNAGAAIRSIGDDNVPCVYLYETSQPVDPQLKEILQTQAQLIIRTNLPVPPETVSLYSYLRGKLYGAFFDARRFAPKKESGPRFFSLELYRIDPAAVKAWKAVPGGSVHMPGGLAAVALPGLKPLASLQRNTFARQMASTGKTGKTAAARTIWAPFL